MARTGKNPAMLVPVPTMTPIGRANSGASAAPARRLATVSLSTGMARASLPLARSAARSIAPTGLPSTPRMRMPLVHSISTASRAGVMVAG